MLDLGNTRSAAALPINCSQALDKQIEYPRLRRLIVTRVPLPLQDQQQERVSNRFGRVRKALGHAAPACGAGGLDEPLSLFFHLACRDIPFHRFKLTQILCCIAKALAQPDFGPAESPSEAA